MPRMTVNGVALHYELAESGRPSFVLVHGGCCAASDWRHQIDALAAQATVLAMDLRGHGASGGADGELGIARWAADVNQLIDALGIGPAVIVGHSLGSRIAAEAVWQRPGNAAALVLLDASRTVGGLAAPVPPANMGGGPPPDIAAILDRTIGPHAAADLRARIVRTMTGTGETVMWAAAAALEQWDRERADMVFRALPPGLPVLAIQSTYHDAHTPRRSFQPGEGSSPFLDWLRSAVPGVRTEILPETGHFSMLERPAEVTRLIREFGMAATPA